ncbi:MAG: asparagine synthase (glutamine-hydrolyzing) [Labilithrix sp.]|nr:asparagine synthase (glutamine-hydrolyzing) [Labilithrix sp.]
MCGVFGRFAWSAAAPDVEALAARVSLLRHRGPDGGAYWSDGPFFLGHRRLAIIDLSDAGRQPMATPDGRLVVAFNGEIYNYVELREELRARGYAFRTSSDTEVLLHGYDAWGDDLPSHLVGMFAFALVDRRAGTMILARDRFGEKPLFCWEGAGEVLFASELAPIAAHLGDAREVDLEALGGYLCLNYVPGRRTLLRGVARVAPGSVRKYGSSGLVFERRYHRPSPADDRDVDAGDLRAVLAKLRARLDDSVRVALRADVPLALFLSGGIDSSLVAESAVRQGRLERAFCVDIDEPSYSEWENAKWVASRLGVELTRVTLGPDVLDDFRSIVAHADDPNADSSAVCVWRLAQITARDFKVAVSGDGGDELFGGYLTYKATALHAAATSRMGAFARGLLASRAAGARAEETKVSTSYKLRRFLRAAALPPSEAHFTWNGAWLPDEAASLLSSDAAREMARGAIREVAGAHALRPRPSLRELQLADAAEYLPNDILVKVDRMTMAHSLESRAPLLHPDLASLAFAATSRFERSRLAKPKRLLRLLADEAFGPRVSAAKKQGFSIPIHAWLRDRPNGRALIDDLLSPRALGDLPFLDARAIARVRDRFVVGREPLGFEIWGLLVLVAWVRARVLSSAARDPGRHSLERVELAS